MMNRNEVLTMKKVEYQRISLNVIVLRMRLRCLKNITDSANSVDQFLGEVLVHFIS